jgi:hypothetical protein
VVLLPTAAPPFPFPSPLLYSLLLAIYSLACFAREEQLLAPPAPTVIEIVKRKEFCKSFVSSCGAFQQHDLFTTRPRASWRLRPPNYR